MMDELVSCGILGLHSKANLEVATRLPGWVALFKYLDMLSTLYCE